MGANLLATALSIAGISLTLSCGAQLTRYEYVQVHMGVPVRLVFYTGSDGAAAAAATAAFARIAQLDSRLSDYRADSELRRLDGHASAVPVSDDLFAVLEIALELARATNGAFDPTVGPFTRMWRTSRGTLRLPSAGELEAARARVGWEKVSLDRDARTVRLAVPGMMLDLGGIGKGYVLDEALATLRRHGIRRALLEAGGDIVLGDAPPARPGWAIEISGAVEPISVLARTAIATSGDTEQFVTIDGTRYSHVVDPRTGLGLTSGVSVTVIAKNGATADAMATAVSVWGREAGTELAARARAVTVVWHDPPRRSQ